MNWVSSCSAILHHKSVQLCNSTRLSLSQSITDWYKLFHFAIFKECVFTNESLAVLLCVGSFIG